MGDGDASIGQPADPGADVPRIEGWIATAPDPVYGGQLQDFATVGQRAEYRLEIAYDEIAVPLSGGEVAQLRAPSYAAADLGYGPSGGNDSAGIEEDDTIVFVVDILATQSVS